MMAQGKKEGIASQLFRPWDKQQEAKDAGHHVIVPRSRR
jgi:hypothetical protein